MIQDIKKFLINLLLDSGLSKYYSELIVILSLVLVVLLIGWIIDKVSRYIFFQVFSKLVKRSKTDWDDLLVQNRVFYALAHLIPVLFVFYIIPEILDQHVVWVDYLERLSKTIILIVLVVLIFRVLNVIRIIIGRIDSFKDKPLSSYFQLAKIVIGIITFLMVLSVLANKSIMVFFGAFGAMTAVVLLVFKDTILGFIASIQLAANDMIRVGDWVSMEKYGADGDVIEINLATVKVRNWDKTITTVPTYSFISDSFKNWRGMQETGSRRIARSIYIDQNTIKFADNDSIEKFKNIHVLKTYITDKLEEIEKYNQDQNINTEVVSNGRRITNLGTFRAYLLNYIRNHPKINQDLTVLVRLQDPTVNGIPLQIYCFSKEIEWSYYESIQSDIFDHVLAVINQFELKIFQNPSGEDFKKLTLSNE